MTPWSSFRGLPPFFQQPCARASFGKASRAKLPLRHAHAIEMAHESVALNIHRTAGNELPFAEAGARGGGGS